MIGYYKSKFTRKFTFYLTVKTQKKTLSIFQLNVEQSIYEDTHKKKSGESLV